MSLGLYSFNLSSKNVFDLFFKLIGILLILPGTLQHLSSLQTSLNTYRGPSLFVPAVFCLLLSDNCYSPPGSFLEGWDFA